MERTRYRIEDGRNGLEAIEDANGQWEYHADAQATIAALQADNRTYINERHEHVKQIEQLQSQLTQRTAELHQILAAIDEGLSLNDIGLAVRTVEGVHAELERMKGREET